MPQMINHEDKNTFVMATVFLVRAIRHLGWGLKFTQTLHRVALPKYKW